MFTCVLRRCVASTVLVLFANFTDGTDSVRFIGGRFGAQMREDKECLFSTGANYGRVWRIGGCRKGSSSSLLLYVHRDHKDYEGRGAQDGHLDFHVARSLNCGLLLLSWCFTSTETVRRMEAGEEGDYIPIATLSPPE